MRYRIQRLARGGYALATTTNTGVISLFNTTPATDFLWVWYAYGGSASGPGTADSGLGLATITAPLGTLRQAGVSILTGNAQLQGNVYSADTASPPAADSFIGNSNFGGAPPQTFQPYGVLQPGTGLAIIGPQANHMVASFIWEVMSPERAYRLLEEFDAAREQPPP